MEDFKKQAEEVMLTGMLGEFREALRDEIKKIEKSGQTSTLLKGGRLIESNGSDFWYRFQVDYLPSVPPDTPCNLIIGKNHYNVTVVSFDENEIILASAVELQDIIAIARLENGATVLMKRLIKRIEENADKENHAGSRMLPQYVAGAKEGFSVIEPDLVVEPDANMNAGQTEAVISALQNDITYIWGPPGTGKTTVIGKIVRQLYENNRNVLVVSHTNTAVDGAIEKISDLRCDDCTCPVLRLGIFQKTLPVEVSLKYHIKLLGEELFERQEELKLQREVKNKRVSAISGILAKFYWVSKQNISKLAAEIESLSELESKRSDAFIDYIEASEELKKVKDENPNVKQLSKLKDKQKQLKEEFDSCHSELEHKKNKVDTLIKAIQQAKDELAKHAMYAMLKTKIDEMMSESFVMGKIAEIDITIAQINAGKSKLNERKVALEKTIAQKQKSSLSAFLSRKAIAQAETELPTVTNQLSQIRPKIETQEKTRKSYEQQLVDLRSLQQQLSDVTPSLTAEYWREKQNKAEEQYQNVSHDILNIQQRADALQRELDVVSRNVENLQPVSKEMFRLISLTVEKKKALSGIDDIITLQRQKCDELIKIETSHVSVFSKIEDSLYFSEKLIVLSDLLTQVQNEIANENETELRAEIGSLRLELGKINEELSTIADQINELEKQAIQQAKIVGATLAKTYLSETLQECDFDTVILDEASMASIPALWCASFLAKRNIVIVGDFLQLPPIVMAETKMAKKWLGTDIFAKSGIQEMAKHKDTKPGNFVMLNEQFRMESEIAEIANLYYGDYGGLISKDHTNQERSTFYSWYKEKDDNERSVRLFDTGSLHAWVTTISQGKNHSRLNCFSAALDVEMAFKIISRDIAEMQKTHKPTEKAKVLIVAPYKPHIERIKQLISFEYKERNLPEDANLIKAGTIHSFQGNEADIVIFDLVLDEPHWRANLFMTDPEMNTELKKLFNVAITRAKFKLFVVGNVKYLRARAKNNALSELLDYLIDIKKYRIIDAKKAYPDLTYAKPRSFVGGSYMSAHHIICREDTFFDYFIEDVYSFKKRLIIYSPFMTQNRLATLLPDFSDAIKLGKEIVIVTKAISDRGKSELSQYKKLEEELSAIGAKIIHKKGMHEKLIFVDDQAVWMGSLNALSNSGETGEIMHRHRDNEITHEYEKIFNIPQLQCAIQQEDELICPICGEEMTLNEGDKGMYWKCITGDYSRNMDQQYPHDGILHCSCGGEYIFFMKNEPRWICSENKNHFIKMREGDLKLEKMAEKIPNKKIRKEVDAYFANMKRK